MPDESKLKELRVGFWLKRLDHTLSHTDASNKQIYVVDGAVLALLYFALQTFGKTSTGDLKTEVIKMAAVPTLLLALLNFLHSLLVMRQGKWYRAIEAQLLDILAQEPALKRRSYGTHMIYATIHFVISLFLCTIAIWLWKHF